MAVFIVILLVLIFGIYIGFILGFSRAMHKVAYRIHGTKRPLIAKIVIGLGCAALVGSIAISLHTWHFTRTALRTSGTVIQLIEKTNKESDSFSHAPMFRFLDADGSEHTVVSSVSSSTPEFHVGDRVEVLYREDSPKSARIDSFRQIWGLPCVFGIIGFLELAIGLVMHFLPKVTGLFRRQSPDARAV